MASANNTPKYFTPNQYPAFPRRSSTTPSQRPSTSGGDGSIEPKSDFLREALREKKGLPARSQSTTPRKIKSNRPPLSQLPDAELFLPSSDDEAKQPVRRQLFRGQRARRASEITPAKALPSTQPRTLGLKEADAHMDKLLKENWDLKHRITLHDQAYSKLRAELDAALEELDKCAALRQRNEQLQEAIDAVSRSAALHEEENRTLKVNNAELTLLHDDLVRELDAKDDGIKQRQLAIEEAAGIIQQLEEENEILKKQQQQQQQPSSPRPSSDYYSGDAESTPSVKMSSRPTTAWTCGTEYTNPPDSDYFSADSPCLTPTTPKRASSATKAKDIAVQMERAKATGAAFNREIGLRSQASKDSLLSTFLQTPVPERISSARRVTPTFATLPAPRGSIREELQRAGTPPWSSNRGLKAIYEDGSLEHRLGNQDHLRKSSGYTPSVTVASISRAPSTDDLYGLRGSTDPLSIPTLSSLATSISESSSSSTMAPQPIPQIGRRHSANPTPVNYHAWPKKLPDWPPSAGLRNRDILFHGTGMDEMFPDSPPRPASSRESFSNVHLLRNEMVKSPPKHTRTSTMVPNVPNEQMLPSTPTVDPKSTGAMLFQGTALGKMMGSLHKKTMSMSGARRPSIPERSRTVQ